MSSSESSTTWAFPSSPRKASASSATALATAAASPRPSLTKASASAPPANTTSATRKLPAIPPSAPPSSSSNPKPAAAPATSTSASAPPGWSPVPKTKAIHLDPAWNCGRHIEITRDGWSLRRNLIDTVPSPTVAPQPAVDPLHDIDPIEELDKLRHLLRLENDRPAWLRVVVWLLAAFRPADDNQHPRDYPILQISGPAGSGKTSAARMLRALVDPSLAPINFTPTNEAAGGRIARDNHVVFIDGATRLARRPAEVLARLSTGLPASFHGEMQNVSRPIIITTNEPDAADRLSSRILPVELPELPDPLPNDELNRRFEEHRKSIVEGILLLLAVALRCLPGMPFPEKARFPEAVQWATAALVDVDQKELVCVTRAENKLQADLIKITTEGGGEWKGTATELVAALNLKLTARALSQKLAEIHPICVTKSRRKDERTIKLTLEADAKPENPADPAKAA